MDPGELGKSLARCNYQPVFSWQTNFSPPGFCACIVDYCDQGVTAILACKAAMEAANSAVPPPIFALVHKDQTKRDIVYSAGATDYISLPLVDEELKVRLQAHAHPGSRKTGALLTPLDTEPTGQLEIIFEETISKPGSKSLNRPKQTRYSRLANHTSRYLLQRLPDQVNMQELARAMHTNRNTLTVEFKLHFGTTVFSWLREQRMLQAAKLLRETDKPINTIAFEVGYVDSNNFSTTFKRTFGCPPITYKKMHLAKD